MALSGLKRKCLVTFIPYGSQGNNYKCRHFLEDLRFNLDKPELAVLAVPLLRGSQTFNGSKSRASSLHHFETLDQTEAVLAMLAEREEPLTELQPKRQGCRRRSKDPSGPIAQMLDGEERLEDTGHLGLGHAHALVTRQIFR